MSDLKMLNSTKYLYKLTFIKCSCELQPAIIHQHNPKSARKNVAVVSHILRTFADRFILLLSAEVAVSALKRHMQ